MIEVVTERMARELVTLSDAIEAMEAAFISLDAGRSRLFDPVIGQGGRPGTRFGAKAAYDGVRCAPGLKVGSYWAGNPARGLGAHGSTTLLLDDETGLPRALVAATHLTALRTAASDAMATRRLARADARLLVLIGTGHQAYWEAMAVAQVRSLSQVSVCGRDATAAERLAARLTRAGVQAVAGALEPALAQADIVVTATAARAPLFPADAVRPGVHISAMGADGPGKQELDPALAVAGASLWADLPSQSAVMGEFQHLPSDAPIQPIGGLVAGRLAGRASDNEITIYDSSGVGLQDLAIAGLALDRARAAGVLQHLDLTGKP